MNEKIIDNDTSYSKCKICSTNFLPKTHNNKFCSDECRKLSIKKSDKNWRERNLEKTKQYSKNWRERNLKKYNDKNILPDQSLDRLEWIKKHDPLYSKIVYSKLSKAYNTSQKVSIVNRTYYQLQTIEHYTESNNACVCCGIKGVDFLTIDHIEGKKEMENNVELKKIGYSSGIRGHHLHRWLVSKKFPRGFQILCWNCNFAKGSLGECPHKFEKQ